jgi:large subunit ribosomal protein L18
MNDKVRLRLKRHRRVRYKVSGTAARPRLAVFRSEKHIYAQLIDDDAGNTLAAASSLDPNLRGNGKTGANIEAAKSVGALLAERAKEKGVTSVVFDRGGFQYHGRVQQLADAAREGGLQF